MVKNNYNTEILSHLKNLGPRLSPRVKKKNNLGRIHSNPVADVWAGTVMRKPLGIKKCDLPTYRPTDLPNDTASSRVACPRLKKLNERL